MWKKGEIVWVSSNHSDKWIPGQIQDPSQPFGILISFFGLTEPRYVPKPFLRSFNLNFQALVVDSWNYRKFVNRALKAQFWNISSGLWCTCQSPIDGLDREGEVSLPCFDSGSSLRFVREMAVLVRVPLRRLAEVNDMSAKVLSFRRYIVDFEKSESLYEEVRESVKVLDDSEEENWCLDALDCVDLVSERAGRDVSTREMLFSKDIRCCSSVEKVVKVYSWNTRKGIMKACGSVGRRGDHESRRKERSVCLLNSETQEENTTSVAVSEVSPDVMIGTHDDDIIGSEDRNVMSSLVDGSKDKVLVAKPVSFVDAEAGERLASSVKETNANQRSKLDSSMISATASGEESSDRNALESYIVERGQVSLHSSGDVDGIAPVEQLQDLEAETTGENQTGVVDNVKSIGVKRKARRDKASAANAKRKKKGGQKSIPTDKPLNLHLIKDIRLAEPKCLRMKFLSRHGYLPSKPELLKKFGVFGKIDAARTDVNQEESSAKIVFLQSIDAVTAYQFARSKKFTLGWCKVMYRLDPFEEDNELKKVPVSQTPPVSGLSPRSCLKKHGSADNEEGRRNRKVKFRMESN